MAFYISSIGVRNYDFIKGIGKASEGTVMQLKTNNTSGLVYPPAKKYVDELTDLEIRDGLNQFKFFKDMSPQDRKQWLLSNAVDNDSLFINQVPGVFVKFNQVNLNEVKGKNRIPLLTPEQIQLLMSPNPQEPEGYWPMDYVYSLLRKSAKSKGGPRDNMVFRGGNWGVLAETASTLDTYTGYVISILGDNARTTVSSQQYHIYPITLSDYMGQFMSAKKGTLCAVMEKMEAKETTFEMMTELSRQMLSEQEFNDFLSIQKLITWFSPSVHKSLIQKIIRVRPTHIQYNSINYSSKAALLCTFSMLFTHRGALVHNIHRFVTGAESALKRAAVSILEDGYIPNVKSLTSLLVAAWIAQYCHESNLPFHPSIQLIQFWMSALVSSLEYPMMYKYDWHNATKIIRSIDNLSLNYLLIDTIKSFQTDVQMISSIYDNGGVPSEEKDTDRTLRVMPLTHCLDQHSQSDIAWFVSNQYVQNGYDKLFNQIWDLNVGMNPRKNKYKQSPLLLTMEGKDTPPSDTLAFINDIKNAQRLLWINNIWKPINRELSEATVNIQYKLDIAWIASLVGPVEISVGNMTAITVIRSDNIYQFSAVKKPIRGQDDNPHLTEEQRTQATNQFKVMLTSGIAAKHCPDTLPDLKGSFVYYREVGVELEPQYYIAIVDSSIQGGYNVIPWINYLNRPIIFKEIKDDLPITLENALIYTGDGVESKHEDKLNTLLRNTPVKVIKRSFIFLNGYKESINLYKMDRHGVSEEYSVAIEDVSVNLLLASICVIYPAALVKSKSGYDVKNGRLMWYINDMIKKYYVSTQSFEESKWVVPPPESRALWEHQIEAVTKLDESINKGNHTDILWITAGTGKTAIVSNSIANRIINNKMPRYCVYTLPDSAYATVKRDFDIRGIPNTFISGNKTDHGNKKIIPGMVNFIYHDHLRKLVEAESGSDLKDVIGQSLFVVDEVHKAINFSIRTSVILELSCLSQSCIALTGTLIKDSNIANLLTWLRLVVPFYVDEKNYWVALCSLISKRVETKVVVERVIVEEPMTEEEKKAYYSVIPVKLGGEAQQINFKEALRLSYIPITRKMVSEIMFYLNYKLGVFVIAKDNAQADQIKEKLSNLGINRVLVIGRGNSASFTPSDPDPFINGSTTPMIVITPAYYAEGYNMTRYRVCVSCIFLGNGAQKEQLEYRMNRLDQTSPSIRIIMIHAGILSYIMLKYESDRNLAISIKGFVKEMGLMVSEMN